MKNLFILLFLTLPLFAMPKTLEKVSIQLLWLDQFQFAGYYMAKEKGFYKKAGLDVEIKPFVYGLNTVSEVVEGRSEYGIGRSSLVRDHTKGTPIILLSAIFQSSPLVLIALESSGIKTLKNFNSKTLMLTKNVVEVASIHAMINSANIDKKFLKYKEHTFNLKELINSSIDLYTGYISNEPYILQKRGIKYKLFSPKESGFDFYSDLLFTNKKEVQQHPQRVEKFRNASLKGWEYAFSHINETVTLIQKKYNSQNKSKDELLFEAKELKKLAYVDGISLGTIESHKIERIYDVYKLMGLVKNKLHMKELIYNEYYNIFTDEERAYLKNKKMINICVHPDFKPYSAIKQGKYIGAGADILNLLNQKLKLSFHLIEPSVWMNELNNGINTQCDLLPFSSYSTNKEKLFNFTTPFHNEPLVIITKKDKNYILDFKTLLKKTFSVVKGHSYIEQLKVRYPTIKLHYVKNTREGLLGVENGDYYGHIDLLIGGAYWIKELSESSFYIAGQLNDKVAIGFGVRKDDDTLLHIFEKLALDFKPKELQKILNSWVRINYRLEISFLYTREAILFILILIAGFFYRQNILKIKNTELALKVDDITQDLQKAQEVANIGSWVLDVKTNELRWSRQTYKIFEVNLQIEDKLYDIFSQKIHPDDRRLVEDTYRKSLKEKKSYRLEHRLLMNDGRIKHVLENCRTIFDEDGNALESHGTIQDVTASVLIKKELKKKDAYLLHQSRLAQMGEMLSMIAHQWRQPLGSISATQIAIRTSLELEKYDLNEIQGREEFLEYLHEKLKNIALYTHNLSQIVDDFSDFYKPNVKFEITDLDSVVTKTIHLVQESIKPTEIELLVNLNTTSEIKVHVNEFMQVVLSLITNAKEQLLLKNIKNAKIELVSYEKDDRVVLEVRDNAKGIEPEIIERVFDPYFSTKLEKNGTGLGLYMAQNIIKEHHNGKLSVENIKDGASFKIEIKKYSENGGG